MKNKIISVATGVLFAFPAVVFAATFPGPFSTISSVNLKASILVDGQTVKSPALVGAGKDFTISWASENRGRCMSNWSDSLLSSTGMTTGSITANRAFVITCFGPGAAQTVKLQVNVGTTDLSVSSFSAVGLKTSKKRGFYTAGPYTLKASVRNGGKLGTSNPVRVRFEESSNGTTGWIASGEVVLPLLKGSSTTKIPNLERTGNAGVDTRYYRVCVDTERKVDETNEDNNCSKVIGPYSFVAPTS